MKNAESAIKRTRMIARSWRLEGSQVGHCKAQLKPQGKVRVTHVCRAVHLLTGSEGAW